MTLTSDDALVIPLRKLWTPDQAKADALQRHPDCTYAEYENGLNGWMQLTLVVELWRNEACWAAGDPPRHTVEGYCQ